MPKRAAFFYRFSVLVIMVLTVYYGGILLNFWEPVTFTSFTGDKDVPVPEEWIVERENIYRQAADKANQGITGLASTHSLDWGIMASIDYLVLSEEKYRKEIFTEEFDVIRQNMYPDFNVTKLADSLRTEVEEERAYVVRETVYTLGEESGEDSRGEDADNLSPGEADEGRQAEDLINPDVFETSVQETEIRNPVRVNTFKGIYAYDYEVKENSYITDYDEEGNITRVVSVKGPVITGVEYIEDWTRMKHAVVTHAGLEEHLENHGLRPEDFVAADDIHKILNLADKLTYGFDIAAKFGYYGHVWPVLEKGRKVSSPFGWRPDPFGRGFNEFHTGFDIAPVVKGRGGDALVAAATGKISVHGGHGSPRGYYIEIKCKEGFLYRYFHLDGNKPYHSNALSGKVKAGDIIGFMGTTGSSTNVHLHFDVSYSGEVPPILQNVNWVDDDSSEELNRLYIYERTFIDPCVLLKLVAPDIENSCR